MINIFIFSSFYYFIFIIFIIHLDLPLFSKDETDQQAFHLLDFYSYHE